MVAAGPTLLHSTSGERIVCSSYCMPFSLRVESTCTRRDVPGARRTKMATDTSFAVCPGDVLHVDAANVRAGRGTSLKDGCLVACVLGDASVEGNQANVRPWNGGARVPNVGDVVTARVRKINRRLASCDVLCVGAAALRERFSGIIRVQDVRATEIDKVNMVESFRPGDVVRAVVLSMGDTRSYYLSTARNDLGVIYAESRGGVRLVPKSWEEMQCPKTKLIEKRKVAKVAIQFE